MQPLKKSADLEEVVIEHKPLTTIQQLKDDWLVLEDKSDCSFFLSWAWINTWLTVIEPQVDVLYAYVDGQLVALGLLTKRLERRHFLLSSNVIRLHQTGERSDDQIWTEYNGFLTDSTFEKSIAPRLVNYLQRCYRNWDELTIGAMASSLATAISTSGLKRQDLWEAPTYGVDLLGIRDAGKQYQDTLSRNTRYQIRRSLKRYQSQGELVLERAENLQQALQFFNEIGPLHIGRWGGGLGKSGFVNSTFVNFHLALIRAEWPQGKIELCRVRVGNTCVGYLYNFIYRERVYFYLSGFNYEADNALKPGLVSHYLCIQRHLEEGRHYYDFLGGDARYKQSLGNRAGHLVVSRFQKKLIKFQLEGMARAVKQKFFSGR